MEEQVLQRTVEQTTGVPVPQVVEDISFLDQETSTITRKMENSQGPGPKDP